MLPVNDETDFEQVKKNAEQGDATAQTNLGVMYANGCGVIQNDAEAHVWFSKAAEQGSAVAQRNLGVVYARGRGVTQNTAEAFAWFRKAAEQGDTIAQTNLGVMYARGLGVAQNAAEAFAWFHKVAEQGDAAAQTNLGVMYAHGRGVAQNIAEACAWYRKAAEQGYANAQFKLGVMYANGRGVVQNDAEACVWYRKAAEQGDATAQTNLGVMYANGCGVAKNDALAQYWYKKAALQNQEHARDNLERMLLVNNNNLIVGEKIGSGTFSDVFKGKHEGRDVAIKRLKNIGQIHKGLLDEFKHELLLMAALEHPSLVEVYGHTALPLQLIMEFCQNGSLETFLKSITRADLPWDIRHRMATQLAEGLAYLHDHHVVHRDIKSLNVLVDNRMNVKWADFGLSRIKDHTQTILGQTDLSKIPAGSVFWMAPEQVKGKVECSKKADVYSFAVVMWELTTHEMPYPGMKTMFQIIAAISSGQTNPIPDDTPSRFGAAIKQCWFENPQERPSARQLANYLADKSEQSTLMPGV